MKTLAEVSLRTGKQLRIRGISPTATCITVSVTGLIAVGLADGSAGAVQFRNGATGALLSTTPVDAPVVDVAVGADGTTFYLLTVRTGAATVVLVNAQSGNIEDTIPVIAKAVALVPTPDQQAIYVLTNSGVINEVTATEDGRRLTEFSLPMVGVDLALSPSGKRLYVLGGPAATRSISLIDLSTDAQVAAAPAAAHSVAIAVGLDDRHVYDFVGTPKIGNIQLIKLTVD